MSPAERRAIILTVLGFIASAILLWAAQPAAGLAFLAWFAYVPFILTAIVIPRSGRAVICGYIVFVAYWLISLAWIRPVTLPGWIAFCFYMALLTPILILALRYAVRRKVPVFLAAAILIVGVENLQGFFFGGFAWRYLAHSQYQHIALIQIADIFGASGVSFLIAMTNGFIAQGLLAVRDRRILRPGFIITAIAVAAAIGATINYGRFRIDQTESYLSEGPLVAAVQTNVPQSVKDSPQSADQLLSMQLEMSREALAAGAELVIWPETMVQAMIDPRVIERLGPGYQCYIVDEILRTHALNAGYVLVGATGGEIDFDMDMSVIYRSRYNSAFLYTPEGKQAPQQYNKIHLVPFGEYIPFKQSAPWLYDIFMNFSPYDYDYTLTPGEEFTVFQMQSGTEGHEKTYHFGIMICYEDTVAEIARRFVCEPDKPKKADFLVNISNDGWFVTFDANAVCPSDELIEHTAVCVFRAVENRAAIVRSVNTGISCMIDTLGRIHDGYLAGTLPQRSVDRQAIAGWFLDKVPIDNRKTVFCRYGQWLDLGCQLSVGFVLAMMIIERIQRKKVRHERIHSKKQNKHQ